MVVLQKERHVVVSALDCGNRIACGAERQHLGIDRLTRHCRSELDQIRGDPGPSLFLRVLSSAPSGTSHGAMALEIHLSLKGEDSYCASGDTCQSLR